MRVIGGDLSLGEFVAFTQYLAVLNFPLRITGWFFAQVPRAGAAAARIQSLLGTAPAIADPDPAESLRPGSGEIRFCDVGFGYPGGSRVLEGIDLLIPGGGSVALVGATGAGKTTLAHLVPRFHDVDAGVITVDGTDIRLVPLDELRREVAVVFQETFLFSATVRENIAFGDTEASDEQIRLAARLAQAHEFITDLPDGYDTVVGERGHSLSGGQRQRVAIARALLLDPGILILDDSTSSVDTQTERLIQQALDRLMEGRTTFVIAQRLSTVRRADQIAVLDEGQIVEYGTHDQLLTRDGLYREIYELQLRGQEVTTPDK
jgi:ATP-binding cassette subfamily B protein